MFASRRNPKISIPECNETTKRWMREHSGVSKGCSTSVQNLVAMIPEWWSRCQVRMRWEMLEQGSERERDITMCIRIVQVITESLAANRKVTARSVEDEILTLVNCIREQCFQYA
jgi:hypothetical protein